MITDPKKIYKGDPGRPEICPVFAMHEVYTITKNVNKISETCKSGDLGCVDCKKNLAENMNTSFNNLRNKRKELEKNRDYVLNVLERGAAEARERAAATMSEVRKSMNLVRSHA